MAKDFVLVAQLSTGHSRPEALGKERVLQALRQALDIVSLDILVLGWVELPDLYQTLTTQETRHTPQVYLWYPLLSDYPGLKLDHLVLNYQGASSRGWGEFAAGGEISETFRFACPNNPDVQKITLSHLKRLLTTFNFDGVFLDKFRFLSPANGLDEMFSCFCEHCYRAAGEQGLDLAEVKDVIKNLTQPNGLTTCNATLSEPLWLRGLLANQPVLQRFIRFRANSITKLVASTRALTDHLGKKLALDVFSPGLALLVGQDYTVGARDVVRPLLCASDGQSIRLTNCA